jgi:hypothetical protein
MRHFGGMAGFIRELTEWYDEARQAGKHHHVIRALVAILNLVKAANDLQAARRPDLDELSDQELDELLQQDLLKMIAQRPEIALWAAAELGWRVEAPPGVLDEYNRDEGDENAEGHSDDRTS